MKDAPLIAAVRRELRSVADPRKAGPMQAYMKSAMPYLGIQAIPLRAACRAAFKQRELASAEAWRATVLALWREAKYREERYAAIELAGRRAYDDFQTLEALSMYDEMIVTGAWWDYVDAIATQRLPILLYREPGTMKKTLRGWARGENIWKRRSAILSQLHFKKNTDLRFLSDCIAPSLGRREFFLRKGIGWALRQLARTNPLWVKRYVRENETELSPLSRREALKHVG